MSSTHHQGIEASNTSARNTPTPHINTSHINNQQINASIHQRQHKFTNVSTNSPPPQLNTHQHQHITDHQKSTTAQLTHQR
jgi:hypothetical protein